MAWIEGTEERSFIVNSPLADVVSIFSDTGQFKEAMDALESAEELEPAIWKWTLVKKAEKGIKFQGIYTCEYSHEDAKCEWVTVGESNTRSSGVILFDDLGAKTKVHYKETLSFDLPIPRLAAKVFRPIVAREIRQGVGSFLDKGKELIEAK